MHRTLAIVAACAAASLHLPAHAGTHWACALSEDAVRLVCVADAERGSADEAAPATRAVVNGTRFPLDPRRQYVVDLWSPPSEPEFVDQLARATVCYRSPGCSVSVAAWRTTRLHAAR
jgi:hypothetical protein